jgi:1,4-alpha-glucan branching enzyme
LIASVEARAREVRLLSQQNVDSTTPSGATLVPGGATFRVYAPRARAVYLNGTFGGNAYSGQTVDRLLSKNAYGYWTGFQAGARDGDTYRFWIEGQGSTGYKRDPYARELVSTGFPNCLCVLRSTNGYPWHDTKFRTPDFTDMVVYQVHVGVYAINKCGVASNFLDVACKLPYIADLGVNVLQPLPVDEQEVNPGLGYGGADLFSPDFPYVAAKDDLPAYLVRINRILADQGQALLALADIQSGPAQLKVMVDLCHVHGIAVAFDVVYNHTGGFYKDDNGIFFFDRLANTGNNNDSLYCTDQDRGTGGLAFAMWNNDICKYLLENARFYIDEFHADGFRYDEISILLSTNRESGWDFCRRLTDQQRGLRPRFLQNAEFWPNSQSYIPDTFQPIVQAAAGGGAGFDVVQHDGLRRAIRDAVGAASGGAAAQVSLSSIAGALYPSGLDHAWRTVTCVENHDIVKVGQSDVRIPWLADSADRRSWYARSRSRFATAVLLTAPGIPQIFMGQEFLQDSQWTADPAGGANLLWWDGVNGEDAAMVNHLRFTRELVALRANHPALRGDNVHPYYVCDPDRVLAYHRWIEGIGQDVIVVASLSESTWWTYDLGFPIAGFWKEIFNSDVYDNWVNPKVAGNGAGVSANGGPMHGFVASASVIIPANGVVVFAKA